MKEKLQFTLGPVQGFVAQARRTRDFWAGSFLLSYLTGKAMLAVINNGGRITFPAVQAEDGAIDDPLLQGIKTQRGTVFTADFPAIGSIPNRFMTEIPEGFSGNECIKAVDEAWQAIADEIWSRYVAPVAALGRGSESIWQRQVKSFWEMSWVIGSAPDLLDRRKNWRSHLPPEEPGDKCTLMGNWQELSGYIRRQQREQQDDFWKTLTDNLHGTDLHSDERLCAIALIKRLFPRIFRGVVPYPSTSYLAAVPWLAEVLNDEKEQRQAREFVAVAGDYIKGKEDSTPFFRQSKTDLDLQKFISLPGTCFFASTLGNDRLWSKDTRLTECRQDLMQQIRKFRSQPSPFYALLLMDGDHLGALLRDSREEVSRAVKYFSCGADHLVRAHHGLTVYAGGDDVLALMLMHQALPVAIKLREHYFEAFKKFAGAKSATISAAIVFAHHHAPLKQVMAKAHDILNRRAKDQTGRDALAVAVWKTGGTVLEWSAPWMLGNGQQRPAGQAVDRGLQSGDQEMQTVDRLLQALVKKLREKKYTNSWIYGIRKLLRNSYGSAFEIPEGIDLVQMLTAELMRSRGVEIATSEAEEIARQLLTICCYQWRDGEGRVQRDEHRLSLDGALLVRFLATGGVDA